MKVKSVWGNSELMDCCPPLLHSNYLLPQATLKAHRFILRKLEGSSYSHVADVIGKY